MRYHSLLLVVIAVAFGVTLAVVIGWRLSAEAMAVVVGVFAGVAASIPTSLIVVWLALRAHSAAHPPPAARAPEPQEPRVIVVAAPPQPAGPQPAAPPALLPDLPAAREFSRQPRQFNIIGGDDPA